MIQPREPFFDRDPKNGEDLLTTVDRIFSAGGWLQTALGLEHRPEQSRMAMAVAGSMIGDDPLLFEAGTGVGKSLAYLIPGILLARKKRRPLVVSSHTIALQQQILEKDLEICRTLFSKTPSLQAHAAFSKTLLVGRGNYVCAKRLARTLADRVDLFSENSENDLHLLRDWMAQTRDGLRQELSRSIDPEVWDAVNADASSCNQKDCPVQECFYHRAKAQVQKADVIILNHSLLFALINAGMAPGGETPGILFPEDIVVLDEAHTVPSIATQHFGFSLSSYGLKRLLRSLFQGEKNRGFLKKIGRPRDIEAVLAAQEAATEFFGVLDASILGRRPILRIREAGWASPTLLEPLKIVAEQLGSLSSLVQDEHQLNELRDLRTRVQKAQAGLTKFMDLDFEGHVHWVERTGRKQPILHLRTAPIQVADELRQSLFNRGVGVTLTSATLSTNQSMDYFTGKCGAEGVSGQIEASPFNYRNQVRVLLAEDAPEVRGGAERGTDHPDWIEYWVETIRFFAGRAEGGTLVLFTNYLDLLRTVRKLEEEPGKLGRTLLYQKPGANRHALLHQFRTDGQSVLLGTDSFWTGIDVPGSALEQVIITKLPFENPGHPVAEARVEALRNRGENPFYSLTLPEAVVKFRQGFGRLMRKADDRGTVVILDPRILRRTYGKTFLGAIPRTPVERFNRNNRQDLD